MSMYYIHCTRQRLKFRLCISRQILIHLYGFIYRLLASLLHVCNIQAGCMFCVFQVDVPLRQLERVLRHKYRSIWVAWQSSCLRATDTRVSPEVCSVLPLFLQRRELLVNDNNLRISFEKIRSIRINLYTFMGARAPIMFKWAPAVVLLSPTRISKAPTTGLTALVPQKF